MGASQVKQFVGGVWTSGFSVPNSAILTDNSCVFDSQNNLYCPAGVLGSANAVHVYKINGATGTAIGDTIPRKGTHYRMKVDASGAPYLCFGNTSSQAFAYKLNIATWTLISDTTIKPGMGAVDITNDEQIVSLSSTKSRVYYSGNQSTTLMDTIKTNDTHISTLDIAIAPGTNDAYVAVFEIGAASGISVLKHTVPANTGISTLNTQYQALIYPNPNNGFFILNLPESHVKTTVQITNILGETVYSKTISDVNTIIDVQEAAPGIYTILLLNREQRKILKFIKQ